MKRFLLKICHWSGVVDNFYFFVFGPLEIYITNASNFLWLDI